MTITEAIIVDKIGCIVDAMRVQNRGRAKQHETPEPYYMYGHRLEINQRLQERNSDKKLKYQKYPLIALRLDIPETPSDGYTNFKLNIVILEMTEVKYNSEERYKHVIKPKLYPLYARFLQEIRRSYMGFRWIGVYPPHTKIDRPLWGTSTLEGNAKYIFDDPLDGIELIDFEMSMKLNCI